ncbi:MAG: hypothetical protein KAW17_11400 [Candidatus Eisenbacteria sp.]|nr:hypothetical protein [Candidatus Eisenbacteria bacterium]
MAIEKGGVFVLLHDERNPTFVSEEHSTERGLFPFLRSLVPADLRSRIHAVTIQNVVRAIKASGRHGDWIGEFEKKYGLR